MAPTPTQELTLLSSINFRIMFGMLHQKGLVTYADLHEQIAQVRATIPKDQYSKFIEMNLNILESTYRDGPYRSPVPKPGDPDHPKTK